jgi:hypothetical protein
MPTRCSDERTRLSSHRFAATPRASSGRRHGSTCLRDRELVCASRKRRAESSPPGPRTAAITGALWRSDTHARLRALPHRAAPGWPVAVVSGQQIGSVTTSNYLTPATSPDELAINPGDHVTHQVLGDALAPCRWWHRVGRVPTHQRGSRRQQQPHPWAQPTWARLPQSNNLMLVLYHASWR